MDEIVAYLANSPANGEWRGWQISRISGSANNILYRVMGNGDDLAVKFTIRDERRRAWREFQALTALQETGLSIAPQPVLLEETRFAQPLVVQSWVTGEVTAVPPQSDTEWNLLLNHYAALAAVTPQTVQISLPEATIDFSSVADGLRHIHLQLEKLPEIYQPGSLRRLVSSVKAKLSPLKKRPFSVCKPPTHCCWYGGWQGWPAICMKCLMVKMSGWSNDRTTGRPILNRKWRSMWKGQRPF